MPEKYIATIMTKTEIDSDERVYTFDSVTAGNIDEKTRVLTTYAGKKYKVITDYSELTDDFSGYYYNIIESDKLNEMYKDSGSWEDAYRTYEDRCKQIVYYITKQGDAYIVRPIDRARNSAITEAPKNNPSDVTEMKLGEGAIEPESSTDKDDTSCTIDEEDDENEMVEALKDIVSQVVEGKFSPDQLIDLQYQLQEIYEEAESAIQSVKLQREALEDELEKVLNPEQTQEQTNSSTRLPTPTPLSDTSKPQTAISAIGEPIDINAVYNKVTQTLISQDEGARRMIVEISRLNDMAKREYGILLTGNTGVGKTLLMSLISKYIGRPFQYIDSTQLTKPGYTGRSVEQYLWDLYEQTGRDIKKAENAVIFFDEIDKKGTPNQSDVAGKAVLDICLRFIEGTDYIACKNPQHVTETTSVKINTKNMIIVYGGAFLNVYKPEKKRGIGFCSPDEKDAPTKIPTVVDFVERGNMTDEFMGRVPIIIHLRDLDVDGIRRILTESDESALRLQEEVFAKKDVKLTTKEGYIVAVANQAIQSGIGARGLNTYVANTTCDAYDTICCNPGVYSEVILTEETANDCKKYQLVRRHPNK